MSQIIGFVQRDPVHNLLWPLATAFVAASAFPKPPQIWIDFVNANEWVKWATVFALVAQGGGHLNVYLAATVTAAMYVLFKLGENYSMKSRM